MHYKEPKNRNELLLYPNIDLWVKEDNPVHLIDLVIEKFVKEKSTGRSLTSSSGRHKKHEGGK